MIQKKYFQLSASGLKNIFTTSSNDFPYIFSYSFPKSKQKENKVEKSIKPDEFKFIFGPKEIRMNRIYADFISPLVAQLHQTDPTVDSIDFTYIISKLSNHEDLFNDNFLLLLQQILNGNQIEIESNLIRPLRIFSIILKNEEIYQKVNEISSINTEELNVDSCIEMLQTDYFLNSINNFSVSFHNEKIIEFLASHFYSIEKSKIISLPKSILYSIITNEKLKLENEDSLYEFIKEIFSQTTNEIKEESSFNEIMFYEEIEFSSLSERKFNEFIENFNQNEMTGNLWKKLIQCFYSKQTSLNESEERYNKSKSSITKYPFKYNKQFEGIIYHLLEKNKDIQISASSVFDELYKPENSINFDNKQSAFYSLNISDSFLCFDFKNIKVKPSHYSIRSNNWGDENWYHLQNWVIECSNDEVEWRIIDSHQKDKSLNSRSASKTFEIQEKLNENDFYRYIRIRQTGINTSGNYELIISAIEFFGSITDLFD